MTEPVMMTMKVPGQPETPPFSLEQLQAATAMISDEMFVSAARQVIADRKVSSSYIQRTFGIGYNRAARLVEAMEELGICSAADHVGKRTVLVTELPPEIERAASLRAGSPGRKIPMRETEGDRAVRDAAYSVTAEELRQFIERFEHLEAEKKDIADQQKDVMAEAKGRGYDTKVIRKIIALRKRDQDDIAEEEAILDLYKSALGM